MSQFIQQVSKIIIIVCIVIAGFLILSPKNQDVIKEQPFANLVPVVNGKQVMAMTVNAVSYSPNYFKIKKEIPVKWEITSSGQPGCASGAVVSSLIPGGMTYLNPNKGEVTVVEFTPQKTGKFSFSCTMNMVRGSIEVIN